VLVLPRSARLAAWGTAVLASGVEVSLAVQAVTADDEPHEVHAEIEVGAVLGLPAKGGLSDLLLTLVRHGAPSLSVALPAPGDLLGLPGPPAFNTAALDAGECVLVGAGPGPAIGIVPKVTEFGSIYEPGAMVSWQAYAVGRRRVTDPPRTAAGPPSGPSGPSGTDQPIRSASERQAICTGSQVGENGGAYERSR